MIGLAETHLRKDETLDIDGYFFYGQNRKEIYVRAPCGSGGVGFLLRRDVTDRDNVRVLDTVGILWLQLAEKANGQKINICVCYIPPSRSTCNVDAEQFFNNLTYKDLYVSERRNILYMWRL